MFVPDVRYRDYFCRCLYWNYNGGLFIFYRILCNCCFLFILHILMTLTRSR